MSLVRVDVSRLSLRLSHSFRYLHCVGVGIIIMLGVAMDTEPYPVVAGLLIRKAVTW